MQPLSGAVAALLTAATIWLLLRTGIAWKVIDRPNDRSLHTQPTPRVGGICVMLVALMVALLFGAAGLWPIIAGAGALSAVSLADDILDLPVALRFGAHVAAAAVILSLYPPGTRPMMVFLVVGFVWLTNLYNFMDGLDGLAGGMSVFGFGAYAAAATLGGATALGILCASLVGATAGFLLFNIHPARIFMGDAGSIPQGFLAAALGYIGIRNGVWNWWFPLLVFSPFIVDATVTVLRRLIAGEKIWQAHRTHYYQRMARSGLGHSGTAWRWYIIMAAAAICAVVLRGANTFEAAVAVAAWIVFYIVAMLWVDRRHTADGR